MIDVIPDNTPQQLSITELNEPQDWVEIDVVDKDERLVVTTLYGSMDSLCLKANEQSEQENDYIVM